MLSKVLCLLLTLFFVAHPTDYFCGWQGNDGNAGTSFATRWLTPAFALGAANGSRVTTGDRLILIGSNDSAITVSATVVTAFPAAPTNDNPVYILGGDTLTGAEWVDSVDISANPDTIIHRYTRITTASSLTGGLFTYQNTTDSCRRVTFRHLWFDGGGAGKADYGIACAVASQYGATIESCKFTSFDIDGIRIRTTAAGSNGFWKIISCIFSDCGLSSTGSGISFSTSSATHIIGCLFMGCVTAGASVGALSIPVIIKNSVFRDCGDGLTIPIAANVILDGNVFFSNTGDGCDILSTAEISFCANNIAMGNGGYGYNFNGMDIDLIKYMDYNCAYNNATNPIDINGNVLPGTHNKTTNPTFTDTLKNNFNVSGTVRNSGFDWVEHK